MKYLFVLFAVCTASLAGGQSYMAFLIPDSLKKAADVVKRNEEYVLTIKSPSHYILYEKHAYTILNGAARELANYRTSYDKFCKINNVSGKLFNAFGKEIQHTKKNDWKDYSAYDGFSLLSDNRVKENEFYSTEFPFTVEYEEEDEYKGTQGFPRWMPQRYFGMSVQYSKFTIIAPKDYTVRYKPVNFSGQPVIEEKGDTKIYTWEMKNIPAKKYEPSAPAFSEIASGIFFAPAKFEVQGYEGDMSSWEGYGKFMYQLIKDRDILPADTKLKVHQLTDNIKDDREKVMILYDFLQKNTRYISIQLGIGGWQPFEASYVAEKKYGDCKALSNYMIALLKEAGIKGKYVEIYGGDEPPAFMEDFPCSQSNHVIACVPLKTDTMWLECTSQTKSPGYMGAFTGNRKSIIIDETGGHVVGTPIYKLNDNLLSRSVKAVVDDNGNLSASLTNRYAGLQQDFPHSLMNEASKEQRQKYLDRMFNLPTYQVTKNDYTEHRGSVPSVDERLEIVSTNYAIITGKRFFITPFLYSGSTTKPAADTARLYDYVVNNAYAYVDSAEINIPEGYTLESLPKDVSLSTRFGKYTSSVKVNGNRISYYRSFDKYSGRYPAKEYKELVSFYDQVYKADHSKIVFVKPE